MTLIALTSLVPFAVVIVAAAPSGFREVCAFFERPFLLAVDGALPLDADAFRVVVFVSALVAFLAAVGLGVRFFRLGWDFFAGGLEDFETAFLVDIPEWLRS